MHPKRTQPEVWWDTARPDSDCVSQGLPDTVARVRRGEVLLGLAIRGDYVAHIGTVGVRCELTAAGELLPLSCAIVPDAE